MFPENKELREAKERMWRRFASADRGDLLPWVDVEIEMARGRDDPGGRHLVKWLCERFLMEREIVTRVSRLVGVRLLTHQEAAREVPAHRQRQAYRRINRGIREVGTVNREKLDGYEQAVLFRQVQCLREERTRLGRAKRDAERAFVPQQAMPVRPENMLEPVGAL